MVRYQLIFLLLFSSWLAACGGKSDKKEPGLLDEAEQIVAAAAAQFAIQDPDINSVVVSDTGTVRIKGDKAKGMGVHLLHKAGDTVVSNSDVVSPNDEVDWSLDVELETVDGDDSNTNILIFSQVGDDGTAAGEISVTVQNRIPDPCVENNGGCGDASMATCSVGSDGNVVCTDIDECANHNGGCGDATYWTCTNNDAAAPTCTDIDECLVNNGGCGDSNLNDCTNQAGAAPVCSDKDDCAADPCQNGGTCTDSVGRYECACAPGFEGENCENAVDDSTTPVDPSFPDCDPDVVHWIGDGYCDAATNTAGCAWDGGDCCESTCADSTYTCGGYDNPALGDHYDCADPNACENEEEGCERECSDDCSEDTIGDGTCDSECWNEGCGWDEDSNGLSDCTCEDVGLVTDCDGLCVATSYLDWEGDTYCDDGTYGVNLNCAAFNDDGGDCVDPQDPTVDPDPDPGTGECQGDESYNGDGWCDESNNTSECGYDGGDCCASTCTNGELWECGVNVDYNCIDPAACEVIGDCSDAPAQGCSEQGLSEDCFGTCFADSDCVGGSCASKLGDGDCDSGDGGLSFNCAAFDFDGGDCDSGDGTRDENVVITVSVDYDFSEASYWVINDDQEAVTSEFTFTYSHETQTQALELSEGNYCIRVKDNYGDGGISGDVLAYSYEVASWDASSYTDTNDYCFWVVQPGVEDLYPNCQGNLGWIGDGSCDASTNVEDCGWDGGDCCASTCVNSTYSCGGYDNPALGNDYGCLDPSSCENSGEGCECAPGCADAELGDGSCNPECWSDACGWDSTGGGASDCSCADVGGFEDCSGQCLGEDYSAWVGDGYCDDGTFGAELNCAAFENDGGDCVDPEDPTTEPDPDPEAGECAGNVSYIADGWCDESNNNADCDWDGGDCCESTCEDGSLWQCGVDSDFTCSDPEACENVDGCEEPGTLSCEEQGLHSDCDGVCFDSSDLSLLGDGACNDGTNSLNFSCSSWNYDNSDCSETNIRSENVGIQVEVDYYYEEAAWVLVDDSGTPIAGDEPLVDITDDGAGDVYLFSTFYESQNTFFELSPGDYCVNVYDTYGDGGVSGSVTVDGYFVGSWEGTDYTEAGQACFTIAAP